MQSILRQWSKGGSPLRGQGTPRLPSYKFSCERFTPARAGNTVGILLPYCPPSVHPCAGREHRDLIVSVFVDVGSPLRGQGTRPVRAGALYAARFTPARAGNTTRRFAPQRPPTVHPCAGREHLDLVSGVVEATGSPLRGQGTRELLPKELPLHRFTPARAGNTLSSLDS